MKKTNANHPVQMMNKGKDSMDCVLRDPRKDEEMQGVRCRQPPNEVAEAGQRNRPVITQNAGHQILTNKEGIILIDKPAGKTSFYLVHVLRKILGVKKIGHAGTLDPFATGVMVMLVGRKYTQKCGQFTAQGKSYRATIRLGIETDSYDCDGQIVSESDLIPSEEELIHAISHFQGKVEQVPPMFSAKKVKGKKLYELARKGEVIERQPVLVDLETTLLRYDYPEVELIVHCSKGTYLRSIAHDLGQQLGCGAHLSHLTRIRSGDFKLDDCVKLENLNRDNIREHLITPHEALRRANAING